MERLNQDIHAALVVGSLSNIDHSGSHGRQCTISIRWSESRLSPDRSVVFDRNP